MSIFKVIIDLFRVSPKEKYYNYLRNNGYKPDKPSKIGISFEHKKQSYTLVFNEEDKEEAGLFMRLVCRVYGVREEGEKCDHAINNANAMAKVVGMRPVTRSTAEEGYYCIVIAGTMFLTSPDEFAELFPHALREVLNAQSNLGTALLHYTKEQKAKEASKSSD